MKDLFGDPLLFAPVVIILTIFGIGYVAAMVWAYNRDAKQQGKKSGCLPILLMFCLIVVTGCRSGTSREFYGCYDDVWQAVVEARPWFSKYPKAFDYKAGEVRMHNKDNGIEYRFNIDVKPYTDGPPSMHLVKVRSFDLTPNIGLHPFDDSAVYPAQEIRLLNYIERRLNEIKVAD